MKLSYMGLYVDYEINGHVLDLWQQIPTSKTRPIHPWE